MKGVEKYCSKSFLIEKEILVLENKNGSIPFLVPPETPPLPLTTTMFFL